MGIGLFEIRSLYRIRILEPDNRNYPDVELYDFHNYVQGVYGDSFLNAPERFLKTDWEPQMDVYALAAISYLLLTEVQPPDSVSRVMEDSLKRPSELGISVSMAVEAALMHALCIRKEERTQTMDIFIKELTAGDEYEYNAVCEFAKNNNDLRVEKPDIGLQPGMKWYKFIIWFQLFATALVSLGTAVQYLMGLHYGENATLVYAFYRGMKILDLLMGIIMMSEAVFCIVVRQKLVKFRQGAPEMYLVIIAVNCFLPLVYLLMASLIMEVSFVNLLTASVIGSFIGTATMLALNVIYFRNRKEMFVN